MNAKPFTPRWQSQGDPVGLVVRYNPMVQALTLAVGDLGKRRMMAVMLQTLAVSAAPFLALADLVVWLLAGLDPCAFVGLDACPIETGGGILGAVALTLVSAWFMFPAVAIGVTTASGDRMCRRNRGYSLPEGGRSRSADWYRPSLDNTAADARALGLASAGLQRIAYRPDPAARELRKAHGRRGAAGLT